MSKAALFSALLMVISVTTNAKENVLNDGFTAFSNLYEDRLGQVRACMNRSVTRFDVCSPALRNDGNAPFILHHGEKTGKVAVLVHGLSDSPFYMTGIARALYDKGFNVIVPLNVGHGQLDADDDMSDSQLDKRWAAHLNDVMALAPQFGDKIFLGGFSTGGALSVQHYLHHPDNIEGLMLFSGALALDSGVERLSKIWGISLVARMIDGTYVTQGPNPYKYPTIASFSGLELMDVINDVREQFEEGKTIDVPVFAAHSQADITTPIAGIENLMEHTTSKTNTFFVIDESFNTCHADVVVNSKMLVDMHFDDSNVDLRDNCAAPHANPLFRQMIMMLSSFVDEVAGKD